jgi:heme exporter protein A
MMQARGHAFDAGTADDAGAKFESASGNERALTASKAWHPAVHVRARGLGKVMEERGILRGIDLEIGAGELVALLGANGAGKSTLLKIISTLLPHSSGTLELFGMALQHSSVAIRARIGLIGHQSMLYHDLSALENLEFFGRLYGLKDARGRALELLEQLGLAARARDPVKGFSRGMAQRVAIARALLHDPDLLLADEPFAGLDAPAAALLEKTLGALHAAGKTIILANHDLRQSLALAQRVVVLARGCKVLDAAAEGVDAERVLALMQGGQGDKETRRQGDRENRAGGAA